MIIYDLKGCLEPNGPLSWDYYSKCYNSCGLDLVVKHGSY